MRTLIEFNDGHTEAYENAGPSVYEGALSLCGPECESIDIGEKGEIPLTEIRRVVYVNSGEFYE